MDPEALAPTQSQHSFHSAALTSIFCDLEVSSVEPVLRDPDIVSSEALAPAGELWWETIGEPATTAVDPTGLAPSK